MSYQFEKSLFLQAAEQFLLLLAHFKTETQLILAPVFFLSTRHSRPLGHYHFHGEAHPQPRSLTSGRRRLKIKLQESFLWRECLFLSAGYGVGGLKQSDNNSRA